MICWNVITIINKKIHIIINVANKRPQYELVRRRYICDNKNKYLTEEKQDMNKSVVIRVVTKYIQKRQLTSLSLCYIC